MQESRERVRAAIRNSDLTYPRKKSRSIWLLPIYEKKAPSSIFRLQLEFLLPADRSAGKLRKSLIIGELSLDGSVRHVRGILPISARAKESGFNRLYVPACDAKEAALIPDIEVFPVETLLALYRHLIGSVPIRPQEPVTITQVVPEVLTDFSEIKGQEHVKRALEIAAAGSHNVLMIGSPGTGKTLMARALPSILPNMSIEEALDVTRIYSIADQLSPDMPLIQSRLFALRIIPSVMRVWLEAAIIRVRARYPWHTGSPFLRRISEFGQGFWKYFASRWKIKS